MPDISVDPKLIRFLLFLPLFFLSLAIHEFSHAYFAYKYGDNTAKKQGRLTLNPLKHIDLVGSIIMPLVGFASGFAIIGWAKPVPVDPRNFKEPFKQDAIVSFAGPFSNFLLSLLLIIILSVYINTSSGGGSEYETITTIIWYGIYLNMFLFFFNLLPIPPLDGSHILFDLFPNKVTLKIRNFGFYGTFILLLFLYSPLWDYFAMIIRATLSFFLSLVGL